MSRGCRHEAHRPVTVWRSGVPTGDVILEGVRAWEAGLIAMATHGRGGVARAVLGSVATGVLQLAGVPLLLMRPAATPAQQAPPIPGAAAQPAAV